MIDTIILFLVGVLIGLVILAERSRKLGKDIPDGRQAVDIIYQPGQQRLYCSSRRKLIEAGRGMMFLHPGEQVVFIRNKDGGRISLITNEENK